MDFNVFIDFVLINLMIFSLFELNSLTLYKDYFILYYLIIVFLFNKYSYNLVII